MGEIAGAVLLLVIGIMFATILAFTVLSIIEFLGTGHVSLLECSNIMDGVYNRRIDGVDYVVCGKYGKKLVENGDGDFVEKQIFKVKGILE